MNWIQKIIAWVVRLVGGQTAESPTVPDAPAADIGVSAAVEHARITAVYTGEADKYATDMPIMTIGRKTQLFYNMCTPWTADTALTISMDLDGTAVVLDALGHTYFGMTKSEQHTGKTNAYEFRTPEPNGYPIGTYENAEIVVRDQDGRVIDRHAFVLLVRVA